MNGEVSKLKEGLYGVTFLIGMVALFAYVITLFTAFITGLDVWLGAPGWLQIILAFLALALFQIAFAPCALIAFMGAMNGWGWEWWQAGLLCFPTLALIPLFLLGYGFAAIWEHIKSNNSGKPTSSGAATVTAMGETDERRHSDLAADEELRPQDSYLSALTDNVIIGNQDPSPSQREAPRLGINWSDTDRID